MFALGADAVSGREIWLPPAVVAVPVVRPVVPVVVAAAVVTIALVVAAVVAFAVAVAVAASFVLSGVALSNFFAGRPMLPTRVVGEVVSLPLATTTDEFTSLLRDVLDLGLTAPATFGDVSSSDSSVERLAPPLPACAPELSPPVAAGLAVLPAAAGEVESAAAVVGAEAELAAAVALESEAGVASVVAVWSDHLAGHAVPDVGADGWAATCGGDAGGGDVSVAEVAASSNASNGCVSVSGVGVEACCHCEDAMESAALTSDAELGTVEPLQSKWHGCLLATHGPMACSAKISSIQCVRFRLNDAGRQLLRPLGQILPLARRPGEVLRESRDRGGADRRSL